MEGERGREGGRKKESRVTVEERQLRLRDQMERNSGEGREMEEQKEIIVKEGERFNRRADGQM